MTKNYESKGQIIDVTCPVCGKNFCPTPDWVYNAGKNKPRVCSYSCHMEARRNKKKSKREQNREKLDARNREIYALFAKGVSIGELAKRFRLVEGHIRHIISNRQAELRGL